MKKPKLSENLKESFKLCIPYYENCIEEIKDVNDWREYLNEKYVQFGICNFSEFRLGIEILPEMERLGEWFGFECEWFELPLTAKNLDEAIELLQKRVDIMKELLNEK